VTDNINPEVPEQPDQGNSILDDLNDIFQEEDDDRQDNQVDNAFDALFAEEDPSRPATDQPASSDEDDDDFDAILEANSEEEIDSAFDALFAPEESSPAASPETLPESSDMDSVPDLNESIGYATINSGESLDSPFEDEDAFGEIEETEPGISSPSALDPFALDAESEPDFGSDSEAAIEDDFAALFADEIEDDAESSSDASLDPFPAANEFSSPEQTSDPGDWSDDRSDSMSESMDDAFESILADPNLGIDASEESSHAADTEADFSFRSEIDSDQLESDQLMSDESDLESDLTDEESSINDAFESILTDTNPGNDIGELADFESDFEEEDEDDFGIELDESASAMTTNLHSILRFDPGNDISGESSELDSEIGTDDFDAAIADFADTNDADDANDFTNQGMEEFGAEPEVRK
jgi:hypothetical protein